MGQEEKNPTSIYIISDLLEEIFLRLPLKSIFIFKSVSKQWRSILESKEFVQKRMSFQKSSKILAAYNCYCGGQPRLLPESRFKGDEEIVYLHFNAARPTLTCDGLVCILEEYWINVLNPCTRQLRRYGLGFGTGIGVWSGLSPGNWAVGFGRDEVTGSYKLVKIGLREPVVSECSVLDVETGEWEILLSPSPYNVCAVRKSVCVNGSIYWLNNTTEKVCKIVALDLHKEEFHKVSVPAISVVAQETLIVNLNDRLAIANTYTTPQWKLEIWSMDTEEKIWTKTYSIRLKNRLVHTWFTPVTVSKQGNLVFYDNHKTLFKYYSLTNKITCLSSDTCVVGPFFENSARLPLTSILPYPHPRWRSKCLLFSEPNRFGILDIVFSTLVLGCSWLYLFS